MTTENKLRFLKETRTTAVAPSDRQIEVIAGGLPRCATSSLQAALESPHLGVGPCFHMAEVGPYVHRLQLVLDCLRETDRSVRQGKLRRLLAGYASTVDFPGCFFTDDLMDMYPDATVILNTRAGGGPAEWLKSFSDGMNFFITPLYRYGCLLWKTDRLQYAIQIEARRLWARKVGVTDYLSVELYDKHNEWVREEARKRGKKVLEWNATDSWAPLSKVLGKPEPPKGTEFPRLNDQATLTFVKRVLLIRGLVSWALLVGMIWTGWNYGPQLLKWTTTFGYF